MNHRMITTGSTHDAPIVPLPDFTMTMDDSRRTAVVNNSNSDDGRSCAAGPGGLALRGVSLAGLLVDAVDVAPAAAGVSRGGRGAMVTIGVKPRPGGPGAVNDRTPFVFLCMYRSMWITPTTALRPRRTHHYHHHHHQRHQQLAGERTDS